jgi:hypothetical protein
MLTKFITEVVSMLNQENESRYPNGYMLDIAYLIASIEQNIGKCQEFMKDLEGHEYDLRWNEDQTEGYTEGSIFVHFVATKASYSLCISAFNYADGKEAPYFSITREEYLGGYKYTGDYDEYFKSFSSANAAYAEQRKQEKVKRLQGIIEDAKKELSLL